MIAFVPRPGIFSSRNGTFRNNAPCCDDLRQFWNNNTVDNYTGEVVTDVRPLAMINRVCLIHERKLTPVRVEHSRQFADADINGLEIHLVNGSPQVSPSAGCPEVLARAS